MPLKRLHLQRLMPSPSQRFLRSRQNSQLFRSLRLPLPATAEGGLITDVALIEVAGTAPAAKFLMYGEASVVPPPCLSSMFSPGALQIPCLLGNVDVSAISGLLLPKIPTISNGNTTSELRREHFVPARWPSLQ